MIQLHRTSYECEKINFKKFHDKPNTICIRANLDTPPVLCTVKTVLVITPKKRFGSVTPQLSYIYEK